MTRYQQRHIQNKTKERTNERKEIRSHTSNAHKNRTPITPNLRLFLLSLILYTLYSMFHLIHVQIHIHTRALAHNELIKTNENQNSVQSDTKIQP